jgi:predicted DCC family thiol-disulfide oxidoreductase YuxK
MTDLNSEPSARAQAAALSELKENTAAPPTDPARAAVDVQPGTVDTLFYDGQCPLCAGEIQQLRETRGASLELVDIHKLKTVPEAHPSKDQLLRVLHLRRADGSWLTSADANVAAWEGTRQGRILTALRWPIIRPVADLVYALWARWRYRRLYGKQFAESSHAPERQ